jgi:hypothetical protein
MLAYLMIKVPRPCGVHRVCAPFLAAPQPGQAPLRTHR